MFRGKTHLCVNIQVEREAPNNRSDRFRSRTKYWKTKPQPNSSLANQPKAI